MRSEARAPLLTVPELAQRLRVSRRSAYRLARKMVHAEIGGRLLVPEPTVDQFIETHLKEAEPWDPSTSETRRTTPTTSIRGRSGASKSASGRTTESSPRPDS